jgi:hypothetical protein
MTPTTTTILRDAFPTPEAALAFARTALEQAASGGVTVQILAGSSAWPDKSRRYRVTATVEAAGE